MNAKQVIATAALAVLGSSAAFAQSSEIDLQHFGQNQASTVSRAAVRADVQSAIASGELTTASEVLAAALPARAQAPRFALTRAQVKAELAGADLVTPAEVAAWKVPTNAGLSRDAVRAEARAQARVDTFQDKGRIGAGY